MEKELDSISLPAVSIFLFVPVLIKNILGDAVINHICAQTFDLLHI